MIDTLFVIPARKGSKGLPGKNLRLLGNKPLIQYSIETALSLTIPENICITTDSHEVQEVAKKCGIKIPFTRPEELATDTAGSKEVILHALDHYSSQGKFFERVVLLQPTSPFRKKEHIESMLKIYDSETHMVVSVKESHDNPYYTMFEEDDKGFLKLVKPSSYTRRQDCPKVYTYNGSVYVINVSAYNSNNQTGFSKFKKFVMDEIHSLDIDTVFDWNIAEMILEKNMLPIS